MGDHSSEDPSSQSPGQGFNSSDDMERPLLHSDTDIEEKVPRQHLPGQGAKLRVMLCILLTELCERLTFYGITANLVIFCKDTLGFPSPYPTTTSLVFQGTCYFIPVFGGWLADSYTGRFNTIFGSSLVYLVGTVLLAAVSYNKFPAKSFRKTAKTVYFIIALFFIAVGTGGIKANVSPFGADQVRQAGPQEVAKFFNWFYWFINIGSFIAFTVIVYLQQEYYFFYGYAITACTMFLAVVLFLLGRNSYFTKPASGSNLTDTVKIVWQGLHGVWKSKNSSQQAPVQSWLDRTKTEFGGHFSALQVEDVKILLRILPIFLLVIMYWTVYAQMQNSFLIQGTYMTIKFGTEFNLPVASLSIFDTLSVLLLIPLMDRVVYPALRHCGVHFTPLRRIGVGMLFAVASVCMAGVIEHERKSAHFQPYVKQTAFKMTTNVSKMNIFYQAPQFILIGASEVFTSITGLEFAYSQAPKCLQGLVMGIFLVTSGLGNYLASVLVNIVNSASNGDWYKTADLNHGHLEYFFFLLGGLMFLNFLIFIPVAMHYEYVVHPKENEDQVIIVTSDIDTTRTSSPNSPNAI